MSGEAGGPGGWHADPYSRFAQRWWTGAEWADQVADAGGTVRTDPIGNVASDITAPQPVPTVAPEVLPPPPPPVAAYPPMMQTPNMNLPGGGAWAQPQQIVVSNASKSPGMAIASLILGVGAFFFSLIPIFGLTSIPFAIVGLALGISGWVRASKGFEGKGLAVAGVAACTAALLVSTIYIFAIGSAANDSPTINSDPSDGICNPNRFVQDPDC